MTAPEDVRGAEAPTFGRVRVVSNGTGVGTYVTVNGVAVEDCVAIEWRCRADGLAEAVLAVRYVEVDVEADQTEPGLQPFEHAPGHRYGVQAGPNGMYARWCLRDDCDWRDTTKPQKDAGRVEAGALVATFLLCLIGISLFALAVMGGRHVMCQTHENGLSYCQQASR